MGVTALSRSPAHLSVAHLSVAHLSVWASCGIQTFCQKIFLLMKPENSPHKIAWSENLEHLQNILGLIS